MYIAIVKHNSTGNPSVKSKKTYDAAVDVVHKHFLSYDFELKDGKPYDPGHAPGQHAFDCFSDVIIHEGKVAQFTHCDGDGPVGEIINEDEDDE